MKKKIIVTAVLGLVMGFGVGYNVSAEPAKPGQLRIFQCVDTASQETVFAEDWVVDVANDYDHWMLQLHDKLVSYVQPSGVVCTIADSVMPIESATGTVD